MIFFIIVFLMFFQPLCVFAKRFFILFLTNDFLLYYNMYVSQYYKHEILCFLFMDER